MANKKIKNQKEYDLRQKALRDRASSSVEDVLKNVSEETKGERYFGRLQKELYKKLRQVTVLIENKRKIGMMNNKDAYTKTLTTVSEILASSEVPEGYELPIEE